MSMKSKLATMSALAAMYAQTSNDLKELEQYKPTPETEEEKKRRLAKAEIERNKANGLKEFFYGENSVWALNQKSADKKASKKNWI